MSPEDAIATREAFAKLKSLEGNARCSVCGSAGWEDYEHEVVVLPVRGHGVLLNNGLACVVMFCRVCGNVRFHAREVLDDA